MKVLIKQARIICPSSPFNGQNKDIFINEGIIACIADNIREAATYTVQQQGLCVSIGWTDIFADFADPGYEQRETIATGTIATAAGGFTDIMILPNTNPAVHNKSQVEYILQQAKSSVVHVHPIGAITKNTEGKELSEMYDMFHSGAVAFSDGINSIQNAGVLLKALQYVKAFEGTVIQIPDDKSIGTSGLMNEGIVSTQLGLPGKPAMAEELMVMRDIELAKYTGSKLHITGISSARSLEYIAKAKNDGVSVTCSVTPYHLYFCDEDLQQYDTNLKVNPSLRNRSNMMALRKALAEKQIDCIASHHLPQNWDNKTCEFEYAKCGMEGLETMFAVLQSVGCPLEQFIQMQTVTAREIFGLPIPAIKEKENASLTLFETNSNFVFEEKMIRSKSKNSAFIGQTFTGKVVGIINKNKIHLND